MKALMLGALVSLLSMFLAVPAFADNVSFTFGIQNAPGGIGDFSWTITLPALNESIDTQAWNAASNPTSGGGCKITGIDLIADGGQGYTFTTFFAPLCDGLYDSETSGFAVSPTEFGTYTFSGTNPDDTKNFASLTIFESDLPTTAPEPSALSMLLLVVPILLVRRIGFANS